jgi:hypothetical protein
MFLDVSSFADGQTLSGSEARWMWLWNRSAKCLHKDVLVLCTCMQGTLRNMGCLSTQPHLQLFARSLQYISMILVFEKFKTVLTLPHRSMAFFCFCLICLNTFHWCFLRSNWPRRRHSDGPCIRDSEIMFRIFWIVSNVSCQLCRDEIASFMSYL